MNFFLPWLLGRLRWILCGTRPRKIRTKSPLLVHDGTTGDGSALISDGDTSGPVTAVPELQTTPDLTSNNAPTYAAPGVLSFSIPESKDIRDPLRPHELLKELAKKSRQKILDHLQNPQPKYHGQTTGNLVNLEHTFLCPKDLAEVLTEDEVRDLLRQTTWYTEESFPHVYQHFLVIIATLLLCQYEPTEWDGFPHIFKCQQALPTDPHTFGLDHRCDRNIPFKEEELEKLFPDKGTFQEVFHLRQMLFNTHEFEEDKIADHVIVIDPCKRLPYAERVLILRTGERNVFQVTLASNGMRQRHHELRLLTQGGADTKSRVFAIKKFRDNLSFAHEYRAHQHIRKEADDGKASFDLPHIVVNVCSFFHKPYWYTMYLWADVDLMRIFCGVGHDHDLWNQDRFEPKGVLTQLAGLMDGLRFLHEKPFFLRHFDIKPENVLVYSLYPLSEGCCGVWKLADFGLSRVKYADSLGPNDAVNQTRVVSSVTAPRQEGAFQPPEMKEGGRVNDRTDMYAIGAVLAVAWAFLLGGPKLFRTFGKVRKANYDDDTRFYFRIDELNQQANTSVDSRRSVSNSQTANVPSDRDLDSTAIHLQLPDANAINGESSQGVIERYKLKPEILQWQDSCLQAIPGNYAAADWPQSLLQLSRDLVKLEIADRLSASSASQRLEGIAKDTVKCKQAWTFEADESMFNDPRGSAEYQIGNAGKDHHSSHFPARTLGRGEYSKLNPFDPMIKVIRSQLSKTWAVLMSEKEIRIYHFESLSADSTKWHSSEARLIDEVPAIILMPDPHYTQATYTKFHLNGDWIACMLNRPGGSEGSDVWVEVHNLALNDSKDIKLVPKLADDMPRDAGVALDVVVSPEGTVAIAFATRIVVRFFHEDKSVSEREISPTEKAYVAASFSLPQGETSPQNKTTLCVCYRDSVRLYWKIFEIKLTESEEFHDLAYRYLTIPSQEYGSHLDPFDGMRIQPTTHFSQFFAFTAAGDYWSLACGHRNEMERLQPLPVEEKLGEVCFNPSYGRNAVVVVRTNPNPRALDISGMIRLETLNQDGTAEVRIKENWLRWVYSSDRKILDILFMDEFGFRGLVLLDSSGVITRKAIAK